jgi:hypothetical protein
MLTTLKVYHARLFPTTFEAAADLVATKRPQKTNCLLCLLNRLAMARSFFQRSVTLLSVFVTFVEWITLEIFAPNGTYPYVFAFPGR